MNTYVIKLQMKSGTMFWMARPDWSGSHFTFDVGAARHYRRKSNAERVISMFSWEKDGLAPKAIPASEWYVK